MSRWPALLLFSLLSVALASPSNTPKTLGVRPDLLDKYVQSSSNTWKCLDNSQEIPWDHVNDDSCDCADGSDEPGTGACADTWFYCKNEGHIGSSIPSSRVHDGLCETQCCDGSDELPGVCPNLCKEIGEEYRKKFAAQRKIQKTGSKIRSTYLAFAHKEKKRLEDRLVDLGKEIEVKEVEVQRLRDIAERTESISQAVIDEKKKSPLFKSLEEHHQALKTLQREYKKHLDREKQLEQILDALRTGYNPNYQDMAVLEAVRGWEQLAGLKHINDVGKDDEGEEAAPEVEPPEPEEFEEGAWSVIDLGWKLDNLLKKDRVQLLIEHDEHVAALEPEGSLLFNIANYIPDSLLGQYEEFRDSFVALLEKLHIVKRSTNPTAESTRAQQAYDTADAELDRLTFELETTRKDIDKIFDPEHFGPDGEWKKLDGTCLEKNTGDYTYEVCMFGQAKQKPNHGGTTFNLGKFQSWGAPPGVKPGQPEYYRKQVYKHGTRCWNGPERSVVLLLECGTENAIYHVEELEKCEYQFKGTTPALCLPVTEEKVADRQEL